MALSETGESRVRGYLFVLERSMRATVSRTLVEDAVREVESHIRERVAESSSMPNEREALAQILMQLGPPATVARAYSLELMMDEAIIGGRVVAVVRTLFHVGMTGVTSFLAALGLFTGYSIAAGFVAVGMLKPIFPHNVGFWSVGGLRNLGAQFPAPVGVEPSGGYWIIPLCFTIGFALLALTHGLARRWISRLRERVKSRSNAVD
jgi:hypothetical protein